jgi:hypothetical protein
MWKPIKSDVGQYLIFTTVAGDEARRIEYSDPEQIMDEIAEHLA